jgi:ligand-binding sensor domain-containing protein
LQGISKTDLKKKKFNLYRRSNSPYSVDLLGNVVASLYKDDQGIVWVGNWGQGLNLVNRATNEVRHFSSRHTGRNYLPNDFVHVIFEDKDHNTWMEYSSMTG